MKEIIVALDLDTPVEAMELVKKFREAKEDVWFKVGSVLFTHKHGRQLISRIKGGGFKLMLDLKYHDIPNTVNKACKNAAEIGISADMLTVHLSGGLAMLEAAMEGVRAGKRYSTSRLCKVFGISILTSIDQRILNEELNIDMELSTQVDTLVGLGDKAGIDGIVCSAHETEDVRREHPKLKIINPGIRVKDCGNCKWPDAGTCDHCAGENFGHTTEIGGTHGWHCENWKPKDDQKRIATPKVAFDAGANFIVMGRQVYQNPDPVKFIKEVKSNL